VLFLREKGGEEENSTPETKLNRKMRRRKMANSNGSHQSSIIKSTTTIKYIKMSFYHLF
jgi:hypothetical protein